MPELPEVEVVRRGLAAWLVGRSVNEVTVGHPRSVRRHAAGSADFSGRLRGRRITEVRRRGKYLWLPLDSEEALLAHLGMSGQLLLQPPDRPPERHLRIRMALSGGERELRFVDQRTFGHLLVGEMRAEGDGSLVPEVIAHIARDPLDPAFEDEVFIGALLRRRTDIKRALLDQALISGIGNIYADEALWRTGLHGSVPTGSVGRERAAELLAAVRAVMREALAEGGTSFDSLYVDVNGQSGYFERGLRAYGREGLPCERCAAPIRREVFMNRSSFYCPCCQPVPERAAHE